MVELIGVCLTPRPECVVERPCFRSINSSTKPNFLRRINAAASYNRLCTCIKTRRSSIACSLPTQTAGFDDGSTCTCSGGDASPSTGGGGKTDLCYESVEDDFSHDIKFNTSDFKITDRVSIGLTRRADEIIFEATVNDIHCPLYNKKVVLRRLVTAQAKRRGRRRAIEELKRLACRRLMYHSYSTQVYGYVCSCTTDDGGFFTLVIGYHGSFSLRHWLQQSDWLPSLEDTLDLDEELVRKVGDDTVGGPAVSQQLRLIRILMRDLLIGVNYLHSHELARTELRLENLHISPVDKHVGILGNAADFNESRLENTIMNSNVDRRKMMIAFDMRCVGFIMAKMLLRELMDSSLFVKFKAFLTEGNDPSCLREFLLRTSSHHL